VPHYDGIQNEFLRETTSLSLPAKVSTRVTKRKTRRGPGPRGTRVGSICSVVNKSGAQGDACKRRSPDSLLANVRPWSSFFPTSWRRGRPHPSATKDHRGIDREVESHHPLHAFPTSHADAADARLITRSYVFPALVSFFDGFEEMRRWHFPNHRK